MRCPSCDAEVQSGYRFCMNCGVALTNGESATGRDEPTNTLFKPPPADPLATDAPPAGDSPPWPADAPAIDSPSPAGVTDSADDPTSEVAVQGVEVPEIQMGSDPWQLAEAGFTPTDGVPADDRGANWAPPPQNWPAHDWQSQATVQQPSAQSGPEPTGQYRDTYQDEPVYDATTALPAGGYGYDEAYDYGYDDEPDRPIVTLSILLFLSLVVAGLAGGAAFLTLIKITGGGPFETGEWIANDFGTNLAVAALIPAGALVIGAIAAWIGLRWGAGLAGGAGTALAGWAALVLGLAEYPISIARQGAAASATGVLIERQPGYWLVVAVGAGGVIVFLWSLIRAGSGRRGGLDPWVAALGAVAVVVTVIGPLIPKGAADVSGNYRSQGWGPGTFFPDLFFVGRAGELAAFAVAGLLGFLLVRRYGLGLVIGGTFSIAWLTVTAALEATDRPIGPAVLNPGASSAQPHAVTIVGLALVGFFALVAVVMALLDADR